MNTPRLEIYFFAALLSFALILFALILAPFFNPLVLAAVFAIVFQPLHKKMVRLLGTWNGLASFLTAILILFIIFTPLAFISFQVFSEARDLYAQLSDQNSFLLQYTAHFIDTYVRPFSPQVSTDVNEYVQQFLGGLVQNLGSIFSSITQIFINSLLCLLALYYFLKDGPRLIEKLTFFSPLSDRYDKEILERVRLTISSVIKGSLVIAVVQGSIAAAGFFLFGLPKPAFWGAFTVVAALIPVVGTSVIVVPAALYLLLVGNVFGAVGLILWGVLLVGLIDNLLRPYLLKRAVDIHPFLILLAVLGGLQFFGPIGFLVGPVVLSFLFVLLDIYPDLAGKDSKRA